MTLEENIFFAPKMKKDVHDLKIREIIDITGLDEHKQKYPHQLSMGQKQRGIIARALAVNPGILLLDEAFSNLDVKLRQEMLEFIGDLKRKMGFTLITATHDLEEALYLGDNIGFVEQGRLYVEDSFEKLIADERFSSNFGNMKFIRGNAHNHLFISDDGNYKMPCSIEKGRALLLYGKYHMKIIKGTKNRK